MKILILLFLLPLSLTAQFHDDFSDGNLTNNPAWQGDLPHFQVNANFECQLNAPAVGASSLLAPIFLQDSATWEFYFRLEFDPSSANRLRIYLQSDGTDLLSGNGYFLSIGEDGGGDAVKFYRQDDGNETLLGAATMGAVATSPAVRMQVKKDASGTWMLAADYASGSNFSLEMQVQDATHLWGAWFFGFHCQYTATRKDKFFFDDVTAPLAADSQAPTAISAEAISATEIDVIFNEPLDPATVSAVQNYQVSDGIGEPSEAFLDAADATLVHLMLASPLTSGENYSLTISGLTDFSGNLSQPQTLQFSFFEIEPAAEFDLLINEIMADPSPPVALPEVEFLEIFNRSGKVIDLAGFQLSSGGAPQIFPGYLLLPGKFVLVCDDSDVDSLAFFGETIGLPSFPALTNIGDELTLADPSGLVIHHLEYTLDWYKNTSKNDGGWTLELVNPLAPCEGESNWRASENLLGGTPGQPNSVLDAQPDEKSPDLVRVFASAAQPGEVQLFFSENLDRASAENAANYQISGGGNVADASLAAGNEVHLQLATPLQMGIVYEVSVSHEVTDCVGNPVGLFDNLQFGLPEPIEPQDLVLNEILFNPATGGFDFIEIYNRSGKIFNLADLVIGNVQAGEDTSVVQVSKDRLIFPGGFAVFTESPGDIRSRYFVKDEKALISNPLPGFDDDRGNVTLFRTGSTAAVVVDVFDYDESLHHPLLEDVEGVSLERINPGASTQDEVNWHSAASTVGFATPTYQNSQFIGNQQLGEDIIEIPEQKFSPDGDGFQDFLLVIYRFDKPGFTAKVKIFDAEGRLVKSLADGELLSADGFFRWDGDTNRGEQARLGIYVVWIQLFDPAGEVREVKKTCVVAGKL